MKGIWDPEIHPKFADKNYTLIGEPVIEELDGITPEMLDWFWANMEKCYFLWAPGAHAGFAWDPSPPRWAMWLLRDDL